MEDLRAVHAALRIRWKELQNRQVRAFSVGDKVEWDSPRAGRVMSGTVKKINQKTILVHTPEGVAWKVSGGMLRAAK